MGKTPGCGPNRNSQLIDRVSQPSGHFGSGLVVEGIMLHKVAKVCCLATLAFVRGRSTDIRRAAGNRVSHGTIYNQACTLRLDFPVQVASRPMSGIVNAGQHTFLDKSMQQSRLGVRKVVLIRRQGSRAERLGRQLEKPRLWGSLQVQRSANRELPQPKVKYRE